jgi:putative acetyltransferase
MQSISVRQENPEDIRAIDVVHLSAFQGDEEVGLVDALRTSSGFVPELSLVAEFNGRIVGHILLTKVKMLKGSKGTDLLALAPMAVVPSQSHRGIGSELVLKSIEKAKSLGYTGIVVIGQPEFYQRFGFEPAAKWGIRSNLSVSSDLMTVMELVPGTFSEGSNVIYPSLFSKVF